MEKRYKFARKIVLLDILAADMQRLDTFFLYIKMHLKIIQVAFV